MLTQALKDWLARNAGMNGCFTAISSINYKDPDGIDRLGNTGTIFSAFVVAHLVGKDNAAIIANTTYNQLKTINGNNDMTTVDALWIYENDGSTPAEPRYCAGQVTPVPATPTPRPATPTPTPRPVTPAPTPAPVSTPQPGGPAGQFSFADTPSGAPTVYLDMSSLNMKQSSTDRHFEMNLIRLTNTSQWPMYAAFEVRLFQGQQASCPQSQPNFKGLDRTSSATRTVRIKSLDMNETISANLDFYQPPSIVGVYTVCLVVHASFDSDSLEAELAGIPG